MKLNKVLKLENLALVSVQHLVSEICFSIAKTISPTNLENVFASSEEKQISVEKFVRVLKKNTSGALFLGTCTRRCLSMCWKE